MEMDESYRFWKLQSNWNEQYSRQMKVLEN